MIMEPMCLSLKESGLAESLVEMHMLNPPFLKRKKYGSLLVPDGLLLPLPFF